MVSKEVDSEIATYPETARKFAHKIRKLIYECAAEEGITEIEESLKWGEPSFKAPQGSPLRFAWKERNPHSFGIYFNCRTVLVETFREIFNSEFCFEGNRGIILDLDSEIPKDALRHCISIALRYHSIQKKPLLTV